MDINKFLFCNNLCYCNSFEYDFVCGIDEVFYFLLCYVGCIKSIINEGLKRVIDREVVIMLK